MVPHFTAPVIATPHVNAFIISHVTTPGIFTHHDRYPSYRYSSYRCSSYRYSSYHCSSYRYSPYRYPLVSLLLISLLIISLLTISLPPRIATHHIVTPHIDAPHIIDPLHVLPHIPGYRYHGSTAGTFILRDGDFFILMISSLFFTTIFLHKKNTGFCTRRLWLFVHLSHTGSKVVQFIDFRCVSHDV